MPRWKTTEDIIKFQRSSEYFDENWMNYDHVWQYAPEPIPWNSEKEIELEDVDLWEIISEESGGIGVYAAYLPYEEYYIVTNDHAIIAEFKGDSANKNLEKFLIDNNILYPYVKNHDNKKKKKMIGQEKKLILKNNFVK